MKTMKILSRAEILAAPDARHEDVPVPQLGGMVRMRVMSGAARDDFNAYLKSFGDDERPPSAVSAALLIQICVDDAGEPIFTMDDIDQLRAKSAAALDVMAAAAMRINGLGVHAVSDAAKNSESDQSDDSGSDSPSNSANP